MKFLIMTDDGELLNSMDLSDVSIEQWCVVEQSSIAAIVEDSRRIIHARQALRYAAVSRAGNVARTIEPETENRT